MYVYTKGQAKLPKKYLARNYLCGTGFKRHAAEEQFYRALKFYKIEW